MSEFHDLDRRVAVLEQIAADTLPVLREMREDSRELRDQWRRLETDLGALKTTLPFLATKAELAQIELRLIRWVVGVGIAGVVVIGGMIGAATQILLRLH